MCEFWYDQAKTKYDEEAKLWNMDTCGFTVFVKTEEIYKDNSKDVENFFYTSNYGLERLLPKGRNKKVISLMKDKLCKKVMKEFVGLRGKTYTHTV